MCARPCDYARFLLLTHLPVLFLAIQGVHESFESAHGPEILSAGNPAERKCGDGVEDGLQGTLLRLEKCARLRPQLGHKFAK